MGWGALAGIGKGISDYAGILGEQRKNDWKSKQEQLKHERAISLQELQNTAVAERQEAGFTQAETMARTAGELEQQRYETRLTAETEAEETKYQRRLGDPLRAAKQGMKLKADQWDEYGVELTVGRTPEEASTMKAQFMLGIKPTKAKAAKPPTDGMMREAGKMVESLTMQGLITPEEGPGMLKTLAWGLSIDPNRTVSKVRDWSQEPVSESDIAQLKGLSSEAREAKLDQVERVEGSERRREYEAMLGVGEEEVSTGYEREFEGVDPYVYGRTGQKGRDILHRTLRGLTPKPGPEQEPPRRPLMTTPRNY